MPRRSTLRPMTFALVLLGLMAPVPWPGPEQQNSTNLPNRGEPYPLGAWRQVGQYDLATSTNGPQGDPEVADGRPRIQNRSMTAIVLAPPPGLEIAPATDPSLDQPSWGQPPPLPSSEPTVALPETKETGSKEIASKEAASKETEPKETGRAELSPSTRLGLPRVDVEMIAPAAPPESEQRHSAVPITENLVLHTALQSVAALPETSLSPLRQDQPSGVTVKRPMETKPVVKKARLEPEPDEPDPPPRQVRARAVPRASPPKSAWSVFNQSKPTTFDTLPRDAP